MYIHSMLRTNRNQVIGSILILFFVTIYLKPALAEDTDIFANPYSNDSNSKPNVLILIDNGSNNNSGNIGCRTIPNSSCTTCSGKNVPSKRLELEACVLQSLLADTQVITEKVRIGIELLTPNSFGGYIRVAINDMNPLAKSNLLVKALETNKSVDSIIESQGNTSFALPMYEAYQYFNGGTPTTDGRALVKAGFLSDSLAFIGQNQATGDYKAPASSTNVCGGNYIIFISNGDGSDQEPSSPGQTAFAYLNNIPDTNNNVNTAKINIGLQTGKENYINEYARNLKACALHITTYTVAISPSLETRILLSSAATAGGGKYLEVNKDSLDQLVNILKNIFREILQENSVFSPTSLPVDAANQNYYANQVYMGVFRPSAEFTPRWIGNLKQYELGLNCKNQVVLIDASGKPIIPDTQCSTDTIPFDKLGIIFDNITSFWTQNYSIWNPDGYWSFAPRGILDPANSLNPAMDAPDGAQVEKGGSAQQGRYAYRTGMSSRQIYTCGSSGCGISGTLLSSGNFNYTGTSNRFDCSSTDQSLLGVSSVTQCQNLIDWIRGQDVQNQEPPNTNTNEIRAYFHGDVVHARPLSIDYGGTTGIVIYYGANDGMLHAIKGGQSLTDGNEKWAFIPPELFGSLNILYNNLPLIGLPTDSVRNNFKPYFLDGLIGSYIEYSGSAISKAYIYVTMRRGGRFIYALDVTNPDNPKFLWKKNYTDAGYSALGYTWSEPKVLAGSSGPSTVIKTNASTTPIIAIGLGYDPVADDSYPAYPAGSSRTMGRGVIFMDGMSGTIVRSFQGTCGAGDTSCTPVVGMNYSIPGDLNILDRNNDGYADRVYAADSGGQVWRIDIGDTDPTKWKAYMLASVGGTGATTDTNNRKFLFAPDVVFSSVRDYDAVIIGSGDREHPLDTVLNNQITCTAGISIMCTKLSTTVATVVNRVYLFKDRCKDVSVTDTCRASWPIAESAMGDATNLTYDQLAAQAADTDSSGWANKPGWYVTLSGNGEKATGSSITLGGFTYVGTNTPGSPDACKASLGTAKIYKIALFPNQAAQALLGASSTSSASLITSSTVVGSSLLPSFTPFRVKLRGTTGQMVTYVGAISGVHTISTEEPVPDDLSELYWFMEFDQ